VSYTKSFRKRFGLLPQSCSSFRACNEDVFACHVREDVQRFAVQERDKRASEIGKLDIGFQIVSSDCRYLGLKSACTSQYEILMEMVVLRRT